MKYEASTPEEYIAQLPDERKEVLNKLRASILKNIPKGFEEGMNYNMIGYYVPHTVYSHGYHCDPKLPLPFMNIASQKNFVAVYHSGIYAKKELFDWFVTAYSKHAKYKLDMGKSCIRFKRMNDIPYDLIGELASKLTTEQWIEIYETNVKNRKK